MIRINDTVLVKSGSPIKGFLFSGGETTRVSKRNYKVIVLQHFIAEGRNEIHWVSRHGHYSYTDIENVVVQPGQDQPSVGYGE